MNKLALILQALEAANAAQTLFFKLKDTWAKELSPEEKRALSAEEDRIFQQQHWKV